MSCVSGTKKETPEERASRERSKVIENEIKTESREHKKHMKLLLLGTGDSGKSTFAKQMSLIHNKGGLSDQYIETFIPILRENALGGMQLLLKFFIDTGERISDSIEERAKIIMSATELTQVVASNIAAIWKDSNFQASAIKADDAQLQGGVAGCKYYFENVERFAQTNYKPTKDDLLQARRKTTGIVETQFVVNNTQFTMVDVGGQRSERKKWLHCFGSVSCVIFFNSY